MSFSWWLRSRKFPLARTLSRASRRRRLDLELLEERCCPSSTVVNIADGAKIPGPFHHGDHIQFIMNVTTNDPTEIIDDRNNEPVKSQTEGATLTSSAGFQATTKLFATKTFNYVVKQDGESFSVSTSDGDETGTITVTVNSDELSFSQQPTGTLPLDIIDPPVTLQVLDDQGRPDGTYNGEVSLALNSPFAQGATLLGTLSQKVVNGQAKFDDLSVDKVGLDYTLTASLDNGSEAVSEPFDVGYSLTFKQQPSEAGPGQAFTPAVEVEVDNPDGTLASSFSGDVSISLVAEFGGGKLSGTLQVAARNGVATFDDLSIDHAGLYNLVASTADGIQATSIFFPIQYSLSFKQQPTGAATNQAIGPPVQVEVDNPDGTVDTGFSGDINIDLSSNPGGGTLFGRLEVPVQDGVATFDDLSIDQPGQGYTLTATTADNSRVVSAPFNISAKLALTPPDQQIAVAGESQPFRLGSFRETDGEGPWNVNVSWGDGTPDPLFQATSTGEIQAQSHTYAQVGVETVTETVTDTANDESDTKTFEIVVCTPPVLASPGTQPAIVVSGTPYTFSLGSFTNDSPNPPDDGTSTVQVHWGDNSPVTTLQEQKPGSTLTAPHGYSSGDKYTVTVTVIDDFSGLKDTKTFDLHIVLSLKTPEEVDEYKNLANAESAAAAQALSSAANSDTKYGPGGNLFAAAYHSALAAHYNKLANDPIDSNFTSIALPNPPKFPPLTAASGLSQQLVDALNACLTNVEQFIGFSYALLTSVDRESGAQLARNGYWQDQQTQAASKYAQRLATLVSVQPALMTAYANAWSASGLPEVTVTASDVSNLESQIATSGLPAPVLQILSQLTDSASISQITSLLIAEDPNQAAGTYPASLVDPSFVSGEEAAVALFQSFAPVQRGQSAGISFWNNRNGQALIDSFNGGPSSTALANWLATTFPKLYGGGAAANNLTGKTNAQVAAFYQSLVAASGPKLGAEVLATALSAYATTSSLGGSAGSKYGFHVTPYGLEGSFCNVGSSGAAFDMANGSDANLLELLLTVNQSAVNGVLFGGNDGLQRLAISVFEGITGDPQAQSAIARLLFLSQPGTVSPNGLMRPFQVLALDQLGNRLNGVVITLQVVPVSARGIPASTPVSTVQAVAVNGVVTFSQVAGLARGRYKLMADIEGVPVFSNAFFAGLQGRMS